MAKSIELPPPGPDDPIFKEGLTILTPRLARGLMPSAPIKVHPLQVVAMQRRLAGSKFERPKKQEE